MLALLATDRGPQLTRDHPLPVPAPGEARVRVTRAGICATDLAILRGYAGFRGVLGHEIVGRVDAVGAASDAAWLDARVVPGINLGCGRCETCRTDGAAHCRARQVLGIRGRDGGFATHLTVPIGNLHAVPPAVPDERAVFAEPLAAALRIGEQVRVAHRRAAVVGAGRLGLLIAQVLRHQGADVVVATRGPAQGSVAVALGLAVAPAGDLEPRSFSLVVDATGSLAGSQLALALVAPRGELVLKSTLDQPLPLLTERVVVDELTVRGSRCGSIAAALALLAIPGAVATEPLVTATFPLTAGLEALVAAARPGALKILLQP
jgi:threonine dehydrogenase-like Zn-dependent dehydrogenase